MYSIATLLMSLIVHEADAKVINFETDSGAIPDKKDSATWWHNGKVLNVTLNNTRPGDVLYIPNKTYHLMGGILVDTVGSVTIQLDGTLSFADDMDQWPRSSDMGKDGKHKVLQCWAGENWKNVTFTSTGTGTMQGNGAKWWGMPGIGYWEVGENRPKLIHLKSAKALLFERIHMLNSPYWTFYMENVDGLEVRYCNIDARRTNNDGHGTIDITAFNTDGFDVSGKNVWIHDSSVWNQDDCIATKKSSADMLFERIEASGLGLTIGSIGAGYHVQNITFRDIHMHKTVKGIYAKCRSGPAKIENVLFENIVMDEPSQYAIWIGPAQQSDSKNPCAAHPCSLCWPQLPGSSCNAPGGGQYTNITLRNITINNAAGSPGVIMASSTSPMKNITFQDVHFKNPGDSPFGNSYFHCENVDGVARGNTWPVPPCFRDETGTCVRDGACTDNGRTCCSARSFSTLYCGSHSRCGCVKHGDCATYENDCCSGKGHKTAACSLGIGYRCESAEEELIV